MMKINWRFGLVLVGALLFAAVLIASINCSNSSSASVYITGDDFARRGFVVVEDVSGKKIAADVGRLSASPDCAIKRIDFYSQEQDKIVRYSIPVPSYRGTLFLDIEKDSKLGIIFYNSGSKFGLMTFEEVSDQEVQNDLPGDLSEILIKRRQ